MTDRAIEKKARKWWEVSLSGYCWVRIFPATQTTSYDTITCGWRDVAPNKRENCRTEIESPSPSAKFGGIKTFSMGSDSESPFSRSSSVVIWSLSLSHGRRYRCCWNTPADALFGTPQRMHFRRSTTKYSRVKIIHSHPYAC